MFVLLAPPAGDPRPRERLQRVSGTPSQNLAEGRRLAAGVWGPVGPVPFPAGLTCTQDPAGCAPHPPPIVTNVTAAPNGASLPTSERAQVHGEVTWPHSLRSAPGPTHLGVRGPADLQVTWDRPCVSAWGLRGRGLRLGDPLPSPRGRRGMIRHCCKEPRR